MAIRINRVYTRTGDRGDTGLVGGHRVGKDDLRIDCYGTVDELNSVLGLARQHTRPQRPEEAGPLAELDAILARVQNELFNLGSLLATRAEDLRPTQPVIKEHHVTRLEHEIDQFNEELPELRSFVLPGGGSLGAHLHLARTVCRRAERDIVALNTEEPVPTEVLVYVNRLSDWLFALARAENAVNGVADVAWIPR